MILQLIIMNLYVSLCLQTRNWLITDIWKLTSTKVSFAAHLFMQWSRQLFCLPYNLNKLFTWFNISTLKFLQTNTKKLKCLQTNTKNWNVCKQTLKNWNVCKQTLKNWNVCKHILIRLSKHLSYPTLSSLTINIWFIA